MKKTIKIIALITLLVFVFIFSSCGGGEKFDADAAYNSLLTEVQFAEELIDTSAQANYVFYDLPENTTVKMHTTASQYPDCVIMFTVEDKTQVYLVKTSIDTFMDEKLNLMQNYHPDEVIKVQNAVVFTNDVNVFLVITSDTNTVNEILK